MFSSLPQMDNFYAFRNDFLAKSVAGREYIKQWYRYGKHLRLWDANDLPQSLSRLSHYLSTMNRINTSLDLLVQPGNSNKVVLPVDLHDDLQGIIADHKGISNQLDQALNTLAEDLKYLKGRKKSDVVAFLSLED